MSTSAWGNCRKCGEYVLLRVHRKYKPEWKWRLDDEPPDESKPEFDPWSSVRAWDWHEAAQLAAEDYDDGNKFLLLNNNIVTIVVRDRNGDERKFRLSGEVIKRYDARLVS